MTLFEHRIIIARPGDVRPLTPLEHLWSWLRAGLRLAGSVLAVLSVIVFTLAGDALSALGRVLWWSGVQLARWSWQALGWASRRGLEATIFLGRLLFQLGLGLGKALAWVAIAVSRWFFSSLVRLTVTQLSIKAL